MACFLGAVCARCGQRCVTDVVCVWVVVDGAVSKSVGARYDAAQLRVKPRGSLNVAMPDGADFVRGSTVILEDGTEHRTTLDAEAYDAMSAAGNELDWFGKVPGLDEAKIEILLMSGKSLIDMRDAIDSGRAKTMIDLYDLAGEMAIENARVARLFIRCGRRRRQFFRGTQQKGGIYYRGAAAKCGQMARRDE